MSVVDECIKEFDRLLEERTRWLLGSAENDQERELVESHCFHFMELQRVLRGERTVFKQRFNRPAERPE